MFVVENYEYDFPRTTLKVFEEDPSMLAKKMCKTTSTYGYRRGGAG